MPRSAEQGRQFILFIGDALVIILSLFIALVVRYDFSVAQEDFLFNLGQFGIIFALWMMIFYVGGLYGIRKAKNDRPFFQLFFSLLGTNALIAILAFYFVPFFAITPKIVLFVTLFVSALVLIIWRAIFNRIVPLQPLRVAVVGKGTDVEELVADMKSHPQRGYRCLIWKRQPTRDLIHDLREKEIDMLVVDFRHEHSENFVSELIRPLARDFFAVVDFVDFYEERLKIIPLSAIDNRWFVLNIQAQSAQFFSFAKRSIDIALSLFLAAVGLVLAPFVALAIILDSGFPIFFRQPRVGRLQKPFVINKFRSMKRGKITLVGRFVRSTHLDEIPQLWNVLRGDMSFVGPRPEQVAIVEELNEAVPFYEERLWVRPGITGWAQLHEPTAQAEDAHKKLQYDLYYLKHRSLFLDLEIIVKTLRIIIL